MSSAKSRAARSKKRKSGSRRRSGNPGVEQPRPQRTVRPTRSAPILPYLSIAFGTVCLMISADLLSRPVVGFASDAATELPSVGAGLPPAASGPVVAAAVLAEPSPVAPPAPRPTVDPLESLEQRRLERVSLEGTSGQSRLRLESDGPTELDIDIRDEGRVLEVSIDAKALTDPSPGLDLDDTPIRSLRTRRLEDSTHFTIRFDAPHEVRTRWSESETQSVVLIDFISKGIPDRVARESIVESRPDPILTDAYVPYPLYDLAARPSDKPSSSPAPTATPAPTPTPTPSSTPSSEPPSTPPSRPSSARPSPIATPAAVSSPGPSRASRLETASVRSVEPVELQITRSASDRRRVAREQAAEIATAALRAGQIAHEDGNLEMAVGLYRSAIEAVPGHRRAVFAAASTLIELNRLGEAITIVREARRNTRDEPGLAMLHAQLIERTGDLSGAIEILDRAGQNPTEAPDVHALAAAYLQRAGEHDLAIARYENLLRRYPNRPRWWMGLGISFEAAGRSKDALDVYRIAMQVGELPVPARRWISAQIDTLSKED